LGQIVGSAGRCSDFDRDFLPIKESVGERWKRMDLALRRSEELPPVSPYKIGGVYFVLDGNHRVSVYLYHGVEWIGAEVTEFRGLLPRDRKVEGRPIPHHPSTGPERGGPTMHEILDSQARIEVRWGLEDDEGGIAELMDLNGLHRALAFEERFLVAERGGKVLAALRYRTESKQLLLGLLVSDPWAEERPLAVALYAGAGELAREMGVREARARSVRHADEYTHAAGYRWRFPGGWYLDTTPPRYRRKELPAGGGWSDGRSAERFRHPIFPSLPWSRPMDGRTALIGAGTTRLRLGRLQWIYDRTTLATCDGEGSPPQISTQRLR
jgi:hypothetical protein